MRDMNQSELKQILASKFDFEKWKDLLGTMFLKIDYLSKPIQIDASLVKSGGQVGTIRLDDGRSLGLFKFEVADNIQIARNRKGLRDIAIRYVDQDIIHGALVFYYSENQADYRLTFVSKQTSLNEDGAFVTNETAPKRYTFLLGENEPCTTAAIRLHELVKKQTVNLTDITDAFSVERLNKDFFKGYKDQYFKFLDAIGKESKENRDYVKKLLGRLVFLQFLQKKGWMGVPAENTNWEGGDKNYLYNLVKKYEGNDRLLSDVLEVLFFNTLNEKRTNDVANPILGDNIKIPYLNGGLFDKDDLDKKDIDFPYSYFDELMEFFGMYNFTIDENDPDDAEVGVDPEMLGHIFENLLEDNKDKGAFYTPKEIVQYMSEESIAQYLKTHAEEALHPAIDELIKQKTVGETLQNKTSATTVYKLLEDVKVCDPAIGSGAFPMGVLNVLYHARLLLYGFTKPTQEFSPANVKREIIQNNIYGVDIEQGAVDIARLRFWLALVVDETQPEPLPNLDFKIMQGNSLLEQFEGLDLSDLLPKKNKGEMMLVFDEESQLQAILHEKQLRYFSTTDHEEKQTLRNGMVQVVKDLIIERTQGNLSIHDKLKDLDLAANDQFFLWHTWFADVFENGGFDVVIGNPPYIQLQGNGGLLAKMYEKCGYESFAKTGDIYCLFYEQSNRLLDKGGHLCFITSNKWMRAAYGEKLRDYFSKNVNPKLLVDFAGVKVFESATVDTNILLFEKDKNKGKTLSYTATTLTKDGLSNLSDFVQQQNSVCNFNSSDSWVILSPIEQSIKRKIEAVGTPLKDWDINIYRGVLTGCNEAFIIDSEKRDEILANCQTEDERQRTVELIRPILRGRDIKRYGYEWAELWLIATFPSRHYNIDEYPAVKQYLLSFGIERLEQTGKTHVIDGEKVKARKKTNNKWFETQDSISYWEDFSKQQIVWIELSDEPKFALVKNITSVNTVFFMTGEHVLHLLGLLNSKLITWYFRHCIGTTSGVGTNRWLKYTIEQIPMAPVNQRLEELSLHISKNYDQEKNQEIDLLVCQLYNLNDDEITYIVSQ